MRNVVVGPLLDAHVHPGFEVLDLGGFDGAVTEPLRDKGANVSVVDLDEEGIRAANKRGLNGIVAPAENVPFPDHHFDLVVCCDLLPAVPLESEEKIFREIGRVLKPSGVLILTVPDEALNLPFVNMDEAYKAWRSRTGVTAERLRYLTTLAGVDVSISRDYFGIATRLYYALAFYKNLPKRGTRMKRALWRYLTRSEQYFCPAPQAHLIVARARAT
jgi:ubiquinone/menaquinone biosynthesis C-methylase UbiE